MCSRFLRITVKTQQALYIPIAQNENEFTLLVHDVLQLRTGECTSTLIRVCVCGETSFTLSDPFFVLFS